MTNYDIKVVVNATETVLALSLSFLLWDKSLSPYISLAYCLEPARDHI